MANYSTLKAAVADVVKTNGTQAITGANLQTVLLSIINSVGGGGYIFEGVATPSTDAGTPDQNVFYIGGAGTYANFGTSVTVPVGSICVFKYNGSWSNEQILIINNGFVYDISASNNNADYDSLKSALGTNAVNIPTAIRKAGMSIKFNRRTQIGVDGNNEAVYSYEYVQYRYTLSDVSSAKMADVSNWQGADISATYYDLSKIPVAVIEEDLTAYSWMSKAVNIPTGCVVKNVGVNVMFYPIYKDSSTSHTTLYGGNTLITESDFKGIRCGGNAGKIKLFIYADTDTYEQIYTNKTDIETINEQISTWSEMPKDILLGGIKPLSYSMTAYQDKELPITLPIHTHCNLETNITTTVSVMLNYDTADYKKFYIQDGKGDVWLPAATSKIRLDQTCTLTIRVINEDFIIGDEAVGTVNVVDNSITPQKIKGEHIVSPNLFNKDTAKAYTYIAQTDGQEYATTGTLCASEFIPVTEGQYYSCSPASGQYAFYDRYKNYISGSNEFGEGVIAPTGAAYIRLSIRSTNFGTCIFAVGQTAQGFVPYYNKVQNLDIITGIDETSFNALNSAKIINSRLWNGCLATTSETLTNGNTISLTDYPKSLKKGDKLSFYAKVTSWGNGITIGKGTTDYTATFITIDSTNVVLKYYLSSVEVLSTIAHGLNIRGFVKVIIDISALKWNVIIQTLDGTFVQEITCAYGNGTPRVTSAGASLTDVVFKATNNDFAKAIWMFGDSYFGIAGNNRELYWLNQWNYLNTLVQGFGGQNSTQALADFEKCIAISKPKYVVWCLGMNDNTSLASWQGYVAQVKAICDTYGITLILATIPQVLDTTSYKYKDAMSSWIRAELGCRYIDVAKAVGSNAQGQWYGYGESYDYLSSDNVHPTTYGAKAIATQFLIDFPEIMQY